MKNLTCYEALVRVFDSPSEPDKWLQDVRFALQSLDGLERRETAIEARSKLNEKRRLELAAPDLLRACQEAISRRCECKGTHPDWHSQNCAVPLLRAAVKKTECPVALIGTNVLLPTKSR